MPPELTIVVPTYKEAENIPLLLGEIRDALAGEGGHIDYEVVIVDDNSPDATPALCDRLARDGHPVRLIVRTTERGLSSAVIRGFEEARGTYIACMDADLSHPPAALPEMLRIVKSGEAELVIGSRYVAGGSTDAAWGVFRWLNSKVATYLAFPFSGGAKDPMAGFFLMSRADYHRRDPVKDRLNPIGYKILLELICKCRLRRVAEVPIHFRDRRFGQSKLNFREQLLYLRHLYRLYEYKYTLFYQITHFLMVGGSGAVIDLITIHIAHEVFGLPEKPARPIGIAVAIVWNFFLNRRFTFPERRHEPALPQFLKFAAACTVGAVISWAVFLLAFDHLPFFHARFARSAALGIVAGTVFNFTLAKGVAFRAGKSSAGMGRD